MRVCVLFEYPTLNGGEQSWLTAWPELLRAGCDIVALAPAAGPLAQALAERGITHLPWQPAVGTQRLALPELRTELADRLARLRPELIHANSLSVGRILGPVASELRIPSVAHLRDIVGLSRQAVNDLNQNRHLIAVSHAVRNWHLSQGCSAERLSVLYNGVDLSIFQPRPGQRHLHDEFGLADDTILIGAIGQIGFRKGYDILLPAFANLAQLHDPVCLIVVGERNSSKEEAVQFERQLIQRSREADLRDRLFFVGRRNDIPACLNAWSLLIHAARQEPLGRVLLEGAASGLPIIATDVGGTREIFPVNSGAAHVVPPNDIGALASAIDQLLRAPDQRASLATAARQRAVHQFDAKLWGRQLAELLLAVGHNRPLPGGA